MVTNLSGLTNATGFYGIVKFANDVSTYNGFGFFSMFLIILWFILFFALKRNDMLDNIFASSFICFIFALWLSSIQLVSSIMIWPFLGITILIGFWIWYSRKY